MNIIHSLVRVAAPLILAVAFTGCVGAAAEATAPSSVATLVEKVNDSVVVLHYEDTSKKGHGSASGIVVDKKKGLILTNYHVVNDTSDILVITASGERALAKVVSFDVYLDLALLKTDVKGLQEVRFADGNTRVGDQVLAVGNPFDLGQSASLGIVNGLDRGPKRFIQFDASINPGNSGGALFNMRGELIGVNSEIYGAPPITDFRGIGLAIPANLVKFAFKELIQYGKVRRINFGVTITTKGVRHTELVYPPIVVDSVEPNSTGAALQFRKGDVITSIDGRRISDLRVLIDAIMLQPMDRLMIVEVYRDNRRLRLSAYPIQVNDNENTESNGKN